MFVTFTTETPCEPITRFPARAYGRMIKRARRVDVVLKQDDGTETTTPTYSGDHFVFPKGATVDLPEDIAAGFIQSGAAVLTASPPVIHDVSTADIISGENLPGLAVKP